MLVHSFFLISSTAFFASVAANCIHGTSYYHRRITEEGKVEVSKFGYTGEQGPLNWAALDQGNFACATSTVQSPINIDQSIKKALLPPRVVINSVEEAEFANLGTTLETVVNGTTVVDGKVFELKQFHMHTPSEHRILEEHFPLEIHMVHEAEDGSLAVIALPFQLTEDGSTTDLLTAVIENIEAVRTPGSITKTGALDFAQVIQAIQTRPLFQYTGSLTTPPCAEGLTFLVMEEPLALNVKTYNTIKSVIRFNSRYTQNNLGKTNLLDVAVDYAEAQGHCHNVAPPNNGANPQTTTTSEQAQPTPGNEEKKGVCEQLCKAKFPDTLYSKVVEKVTKS